MAGIGLLWMAASLLGCVSLEQLAPPIGDRVVVIGRDHGFDLNTLSHGRQVYLSRCIQCHNLEPIQRYSQAQWQAIVMEMAVEAKIDTRQTSDLLAYLLTARRVEPPDPKSHRKAAPKDKAVPQSPSS